MTKRSVSMVWVAISIAFMVLTAISPLAAEEFYKGKTIRIMVGFSPGGGFDTYSRAIARHIPKHIPGKPTIIVINRPGAGSLITANYLYNKSKPDGLTIGNFIGHLVLSQVLNRPGIKFDARKFRWIGLPIAEHGACALTKASGITSLEKWQNAKTPVKLGASGIGNVDYNSAKILKDILGLPIQIISGFRGSAITRLAAEGGEIAGSCWQWEAIKPTWKAALDKGKVGIVLQFGSKPHPDLPNVPLAASLAKTDEARLLMKTAIDDPNLITISYALPPGTPEDRVRILRSAFMATMNDPEFVADAKRTRLDLDPITGEEMEKIVESNFKLDPSLVAKLRSLILK